MKRMISFVLALVLTVGLFAFTAHAEEVSGEEVGIVRYAEEVSGEEVDIVQYAEEVSGEEVDIVQYAEESGGFWAWLKNLWKRFIGIFM